MKVFLMILCFVTIHINSQASDTLTIVAVGEAEAEADIIQVESSVADTVTPAQKTNFNKLLQIIKDDFAFYKDKFEVSLDNSATTKSRYELKANLATNLEIKLNDKTTSKELLSLELKFEYQNHRAFSHNIAAKVYKAITGKESIFETKILFVSDRTSRNGDLRKEIYIMDFDGERKQRLTFENSIVISPSLSHDNSKVLYTLIETQFKKNKLGKTQKIKNLNLYELNLNTKKTRLISNVKGINSGAVYNKTGDSIYLTLSYQKNADIFKMNLSSKKLTRITSHYSDDVDPHINADESMMTMLSGRPGKAMIYTLDPRGKEKNVKRISYVGRFNAAPRFNREGTQIVFSSWVDNRFDIYRIDSDGRNLVRLTKNFGSNEEPWFSPDGQFIVFTSQRVISQKKAVQDMYIMNIDGEIIKKISTNYGKISTPRWSN